MNKLLVTIFIFLLFFAVSCGDGDDGDTGNTGNTGDTGDTGDTGTDEEVNDTDAGEENACMNMDIIEPDPDYESYFALNVIAEINPFGPSNEMKEADQRKT